MGSLQQAFRKAAVAAFNAAGDIIEPGWYYAYQSTSYNISTGLTSDNVSVTMVSMLFSTYNDRDIDGSNVLPSDLKASFPQDGLWLRPQIDDEIQRKEAQTSVVYAVVGVKQDPAGALWNLQLRKP